MGTWHVLSDQDGHPRGGLRLNALDEVESQRLDSLLQSAAVPGLLAVVDQVHDGHGRWLITEVPAAPTVAQTLAARVALPPAVALLIAVDTGETLAALHKSQLAHGALSGDSVVLSNDGRALLAECGYSHALAGTTAGPGHDVTGWVKLLRELAAPRPKDQAKHLLSEAAERAEALGGNAGLLTALAAMSHEATQVNGFGERSALAVLAALVPAQLAPAPQAVPKPASSSNATTYALGDDASAAVTVPAPPKPVVGQTAIMPDAGDQETLRPAQLAEQMGRRKEEVLRFGRGVASLPPPRQHETSPAWDDPYVRPRPPKPWRARIIAGLSMLTTLLLLALVGWWLIQRLAPLEISGATVALAEPLGERCDVEVRVVGTISTNGSSGTITYRWVTSDGRTTSVLSEQVNLGTEQVQVPLLWKFSGRSTVEATATLQILTPRQLEASTDFTYSCNS